MNFINKKNQNNITIIYILRFPLFKIIKNIHAYIYGGLEYTSYTFKILNFKFYTTKKPWNYLIPNFYQKI